MALIIGRSIRRKEFGEVIPEDDLGIIVRSTKVELTTPIKGEGYSQGYPFIEGICYILKGRTPNCLSFGSRRRGSVSTVLS